MFCRDSTRRDTYMDAVLVRSTQDVMGRDGERVNTPSRRLQVPQTLQSVQTPDLNRHEAVDVLTHYPLCCFMKHTPSPTTCAQTSNLCEPLIFAFT